tara:strand:- start:3825 stop:5042 length:1218 start_codon:yes stop_codon:yes gene_type:complete
MKVTLILGRGIEGCGVTKFSIEQMRWMKEHGYDYRVFASKDKKWTRTTSHECQEIEELKFADKESIDTIVAHANTCDVVVFNSLPSIKHPEGAIAGFLDLLDRIDTKVALIQHDHSMLSINRNAGLKEAVKRADIIFAHSMTNDFVQYAKDVSGSDSFGLFETAPVKNFSPFQPGINFEAIKDQYWKPLDETNVNEHKWIGRTTTWKGFKQMFQFHRECLSTSPQIITTFEGIEKSPAFMIFKTCGEFNECIKYKIEDYTDMNGGELPYVFGPYNNEDLMHRLSRSGFGYQLSILKPHFIERSIEYTHAEVVCAGAIPVFRKKYGDQCTHRVYGKALTACENSGTIWLDDDNMKPAWDLMVKLSNDPELRDKWRKDAYDFYKLHQDSEYTFGDIFNKITETCKTT